jgi:hypothetical protein
METIVVRNSAVSRVVAALSALFRCHHPADKRSRPFNDKRLGMFKVCLECGTKIKYSMPVAITDHPYLHEGLVEA